LLNLLQGGAVDIADVSPPYNTDKLPLSAVSALPAMFSNSCEGSLGFWKLASKGPLATSEYAPLGLRVLFGHALVPYQVYMGKSKFENLSDLEGKRLRSSGGPMDLVIQKLGAVPIKITSPEVYESFSRGTRQAVVQLQQSPLGSQDRLDAVEPGQAHESVSCEFRECDWLFSSGQRVVPIAHQPEAIGGETRGTERRVGLVQRRHSEIGL
jgi:hypothetical protein